MIKAIVRSVGVRVWIARFEGASVLMELMVECLVTMGFNQHCRSGDCVTEYMYNVTTCPASLLAPCRIFNWDQQ